VGGSHGGAEIMLVAILSGARFVEVPVNYLPRVGTSSVTGKPLAAVLVGLRMILLILRFRRMTPRRRARPPALAKPQPSPGERTREHLAL
jgi:dolichol-phosphate mannosyltransferase